MQRAVEHVQVPDGRSIAPQFVGMNDFWDVVLTQQAEEEGPHRLGVAVLLQEDIQHVSVIVHRPPQPVVDPADLNAHLVQMPSRTPPGFSMTHFLGEERREFDVPLPLSSRG